MSPGAARRAAPRPRSASRLAAVQALYSMDVAGSAARIAVADLLRETWPSEEGAAPRAEPDIGFLRTLVDGVAAERTVLDAAIQQALSAEWTFTRLELLLQAILRAGAYELAACPDVPPKVVINEYLELAHDFFAGKEPSLVNAVLDRLAARFRGQPAPGGGAQEGGGSAPPLPGASA